MKYFVIVLFILFTADICSKDLARQDKIYLYALSLEGASSGSLKNYSGFISNVTKFLQDFDKLDYCDLEPLVGTLHNILLETLYHCDVNASRAVSFNEAVSGKNTPDSLHYAVLMHDALIIRGIYTKFFSINGSFYGIKIPCKTKTFYWSILNPIIGHTTWSKSNLLRTYIKYQNPKIDRDALLTKEANIKDLSKDNLVNIIRDMNKTKLTSLPLKKNTKINKTETYNIKKKYQPKKTKEPKKVEEINKIEKNIKDNTKSNIKQESKLLGREFQFHKISDEKIDLKRLSKNIEERFYADNLSSLEACVKKEHLYKRWITLSYIITKNGALKSIALDSGKKDLNTLSKCFKKILSKLVYISIDADIKISHYLYFKD